MGKEKEQMSPRLRLVRDAATFQLKLMADGIRDAMLIPVSIVAAIVGLLRGGDKPEVEFQRVLEIGRRTERWINLFGGQQSFDHENPVGSMDQVLAQAQSVVVEQYKKGRPTAEELANTKEKQQNPESEPEPGENHEENDQPRT